METGHLDPILVQGIIQSVYRLFRVGTFHALDNDAIVLSIEQTLRALRRLEAFESEGITLIFAEDTCIVNGQLLQAPPDVYQSAMDFSEFLGQVRVNSITIGKGVADEDLRALLALFVDPDSAPQRLDAGGFLTRHIRLRLVNPNLLLGLEDERLSLLERVLLTYALAVLVIRRLFESIEHGGFDLAGYFKRMARQLATVNYADRPVVLDVILARHLEPDTAKLAVNSAILSVAMTRRFTDHEATLGRICMSSLLLDVGRHRAATLGVDDADLSISTAVIHMAMGDLRGDSVERTIVTFEVQRMLAGVPANEIYPDGVEPTIDAHLVANARRFTELVSRREGGTQLTPDGAIEVLRRRATSDLGHMTLDLLVDALGLIPRGAAVELSSGYHAVVTKAGPSPSQYDRPTVQLITDNRGQRTEERVVMLSADNEDAATHSPVVRVINRPNAFVRSAQNTISGPFFEWVGQRRESEARVRKWLAEHNKFPEAPLLTSPRSQSTSTHAVVAGDARRAAVVWDQQSTNTTTTRVLERSSAAAEYEYRKSASFEAVPDDFASNDRPGSSVRARSSVRRALGSENHRSQPPVEGGGIYRRATSSSPVVVDESFVRTPSTRTEGGANPCAATPAPSMRAGPEPRQEAVDPATFDSASASGVFRDASGRERTVRPGGSSDSGVSSILAPDGVADASPSGVLRDASGRHRAPTGQWAALEAVSENELGTDAGSGAFRAAAVRRRAGSGPAADPNVFGEEPRSGSFREPSPSVWDRAVSPHRDTAETPVAGVDGVPSARPERPTARSERIVGAGGGQAEILRRSKTTGSHQPIRQRSEGTGERMSIKEHLAAASRRAEAGANSASGADAPFSSVLRRRTTSNPAIGSDEPPTHSSDSHVGPGRVDIADTPFVPIEAVRALDALTNNSSDDE